LSWLDEDERISEPSPFSGAFHGRSDSQRKYAQPDPNIINQSAQKIVFMNFPSALECAAFSSKRHAHNIGVRGNARILNRS